MCETRVLVRLDLGISKEKAEVVETAEVDRFRVRLETEVSVGKAR